MLRCSHALNSPGAKAGEHEGARDHRVTIKRFRVLNPNFPEVERVVLNALAAIASPDGLRLRRIDIVFGEADPP